jgi:hypothetical protein
VKKFYVWLVLILALLAAPAFAQIAPISPGLQTFACFIEGATVTTQCQPAPTTGSLGTPLKLVIVSISLTNAVGTAQTLDVISGTGTNCATNPTAFTNKVGFGAAVGNWTIEPSPAAFVLPPQTAVCVRPSAATAFGATITGFVSP